MITTGCAFALSRVWARSRPCRCRRVRRLMRAVCWGRRPGIRPARRDRVVDLSHSGLAGV